MQVNPQTGRARPVLIQGLPPVVGSNDDDDDDEDEDDQLIDNPSMPSRFHRPIIYMPMVNPFIATNGHSYEAAAIQTQQEKAHAHSCGQVSALYRTAPGCQVTYH